MRGILMKDVRFFGVLEIKVRSILAYRRRIVSTIADKNLNLFFFRP
jgi:hypothetical protein